MGRRWFGEVYPGSSAPVVDSEGVEGKLAGVQGIRAHDAAFDEDAFLAQSQRVFFAVLEAWTELKPELSQGVMAPVIWEQQKAQIADYRLQGRRNFLENLSLTSAIVAGARSDGHFDTLTVRINASSADYDVESLSGKAVRGDRQSFDWTEDWIFQRPASSSTLQTSAPTSLVCPNCGAPVNVDVTSVCSYCGAAVVSGQFGWLLTRIDRV